MASKNLIIVHLLTATLTLKVAQGCREDGTIRCTWTRGPPPSVALIHCETDIPGNRLHEDQYTEISGRVNYTRWTVQQRPCLFKIGVNCAHIFIRIDSPTDEQNISVCRIPDALNQRSVCSCLDLREVGEPTTVFTPSASTETTTQEADPSLEGNRGGNDAEQLTEHTGFVTIVSLCVTFVAVLAMMGILLVMTCWHFKRKLAMLQKADVEGAHRTCRARSDAVLEETSRT